MAAPSGGPGPLLASGRTADVFALDDARVLRRYRDGRPAAPVAAAMSHLAGAGYPVPAVLDVDGPDLVLGRVDGPTIGDDLARRPWRLFRHADLLADLHRRLHVLEPPPGLRPRFGGGHAVLHLDLHPLNVLLGPAGPVVIDWDNVCRGPAEADVAQTWIVVSTSSVPGPALQRLAARPLVGALVRRFRSHFDAAAVDRVLGVVAAERRLDANVTADERGRIDALVARRGVG